MTIQKLVLLFSDWQFKKLVLIFCWSKDDNISFEQILNESIKCHHIDVANYILNNYLQNENENEFSKKILIDSLKYYNFTFMQSNIEDETSFCYLCKNDNFLLVFLLLNNTDIDINTKLFLYKITS